MGAVVLRGSKQLRPGACGRKMPIFWVGQAGAMLTGTSLEVRASALTFLPRSPALLPQPFQLGCWKLQADDEGSVNVSGIPVQSELWKISSKAGCTR